MTKTEYYTYLKSIGFCVQCQKEKALANKVHCAKCAEKSKINSKKYYVETATNRQTDAFRIRARVYQKNLRERRKAAKNAG